MFIGVGWLPLTIPHVISPENSFMDRIEGIDRRRQQILGELCPIPARDKR